MVNVTFSAKQELLRRKASDSAESGGLTLRIVPGGVEEPVLVPDIRRVEDEVVEHLGMPVLLVARDVVRWLGETIIDCRFTPHGARIRLRPKGPRSSTAESVGCGSDSGAPVEDETGLASRDVGSVRLPSWRLREPADR